MERAMAGDAVVSADEVLRKQLPFEFMLNALRLRDGFTLQQFTERTGLPLSSIDQALQQAQAQGLVTLEASLVRPTARGFDFLSDLQGLFLAD
jgi:oxygen-independent coproporphyrinogen-3 oxidase